MQARHEVLPVQVPPLAHVIFVILSGRLQMPVLRKASPLKYLFLHALAKIIPDISDLGL